jgi:hypothetical protein
MGKFGIGGFRAAAGGVGKAGGGIGALRGVGNSMRTALGANAARLPSSSFSKATGPAPHGPVQKGGPTSNAISARVNTSAVPTRGKNPTAQPKEEHLQPQTHGTKQPAPAPTAKKAPEHQDPNAQKKGKEDGTQGSDDHTSSGDGSSVSLFSVNVNLGSSAPNPSEQPAQAPEEQAPANTGSGKELPPRNGSPDVTKSVVDGAKGLFGALRARIS